MGRWKSAPHPFAQLQLQCGHVCYGCCQVLFWGAARVENDLAGGVCVVVVWGRGSTVHMRQDFHVLHATDNSIKCRYFNSLPSLSLSLLMSDVTICMLHAAACCMLTRLLPLNIRFDAF